MAAASRSAFQAQGSSRSSSWALVRPETMRSSASDSYAKGSTPFSFAVATRLATIAQWRAPPSEPAKEMPYRAVPARWPRGTIAAKPCGPGEGRIGRP